MLEISTLSRREYRCNLYKQISSDLNLLTSYAFSAASSFELFASPLQAFEVVIPLHEIVQSHLDWSNIWYRREILSDSLIGANTFVKQEKREETKRKQDQKSITRLKLSISSSKRVFTRSQKFALYHLY